MAQEKDFKDEFHLKERTTKFIQKAREKAAKSKATNNPMTLNDILLYWIELGIKAENLKSK